MRYANISTSTVKPRKHPRFLRYIQQLQGDSPWGTFLDAGTGVQSLRWIAELGTERWTGVSASPAHAERVREAIKEAQRPEDRVVLGNWVDTDLLKGEQYDTVMADYLLGAIEGFAPYYQPYLFKRLRPLTRTRLYVKGLEPYVSTMRPQDPAGRILWEIGRFRDACVLHGNDLPYREYPAGWVVDNLRMNGFEVLSVKHFDIRYKKLFVNAQIDVCAPILEKLADRALAKALRARGEALRAEALEVIKSEGTLRSGRNYVIAAKPI